MGLGYVHARFAYGLQATLSSRLACGLGYLCTARPAVRELEAREPTTDDRCAGSHRRGGLYVVHFVHKRLQILESGARASAEARRLYKLRACGRRGDWAVPLFR